MGILEQVNQMKREGRKDSEIIAALKEQKVNPKDIDAALRNASIVSAVRGDDPIDMPPTPLPQGDQQYSPDQGYADYNQEQQPQDYGGNNGYGQNQEQVYTPQPQEYYPQQNYSGYDEYQPNTDTIVEISEQVFEEKISSISKKVDSIDEFKSLTQTRLDQLNERLKRIEMIIDRLQSAILEKVGSYGNNIDSIKKEMSMMQDSFSKTLGSMVDIAQNKSPRQSQQEEPESVNKISKKRK